MGALLILVGLLLAVTAYRNTAGSLASHLSQDLNGQFLAWVAALILVGIIGYIPGLTTISRAFLALVVLVIFLTSGSGFVDKFRSALSAPAADTPAPASGPLPDPTLKIQLQGNGSGGGVGDIAGKVAGAAIGGM